MNQFGHLGWSDHDFDPTTLARVLQLTIAREKGVSAYVGDGLNRWTAVHRLDAARLYRLALEKGKAGSSYHAVAEEGVAFKDIATVIGRRLNLPVVSLAQDDAMAHFGLLGMLAGLDIPASSAKTQATLGWTPAHAALLPDLEASYFER